MCTALDVDDSQVSGVDEGHASDVTMVTPVEDELPNHGKGKCLYRLAL